MEREYNRVGFNKIGFKLKYEYILKEISDLAYEGKVKKKIHSSLTLFTFFK